MAFLTKSNAKRILGQADLRNIELPGIIYERPIYFFNKIEINILLAHYNFYKNPEFFASIFKKIYNEDKFEFVWEGYAPAYHKDNECGKVHSSFQNTRIPDEIREAGEKAVWQFREWVKKSDKSEMFRGYSLNQLETVKYDNSGQENFDDVDLSELKNSVDTVLDSLTDFIAASGDVTRRIIVTYDKYTYFAGKNMPFPTLLDPSPRGVPKEIPFFDKRLGISENELRSFLIDFEARFKAPVAARLKTYYRIMYNPKLEFEGTLLNQLGFRKCSFCFPKE